MAASDGKSAYVRLVADVFAGMRPRPTVSRRMQTGLVEVAVGGRVIAEVGPPGVRVGEQREWQPLRVHSPEDRLKILEMVQREVARLELLTAEDGVDDELPDARDVRDELLARGAPASVEDGEVVVEGVGWVDREAGLEARYVARRFVRDHTQEHVEMLERRLMAVLPDDPAVTVRRVRGAVLIEVHGVPAARVDGFRISGLRGVGDVDGNFLHPRIAAGQAFGVLRDALVAQLAARPTTVPAGTVLTVWPDRASRALMDAGDVASERLRTERRLDPALRIEVPTSHGDLRFEPLREGENPLEARFSLTKGKTVVRAALRLKTPADPLAIRVVEDARLDLLTEAWVAALIVYAQLTCAEGAEAGAFRQGPFPQQRVSSGPSGGKSVRTARSGEPATHGERLVVSNLAQARDALRAVSGHLRRLAAPRTCSPEAQRAAEQVGIAIPSGYTWVRAHSRGKRVIRVESREFRQLW